MPTLPRRRSRQPRPRIVVLGDLMLDLVLAPARALEPDTDVPGTVALRQGGSAANTARWLARLGARATLVAAVGRDAAGRALVAAIRRHGVVPRVARIAGARTGRVGVLVAPGGQRLFVTDRGAADRIRPEDVDAATVARADLLHLPGYSLVGEPLASAARRAVEIAHASGVAVSLDLASSGPLLAGGRRNAIALVEAVRPDLLFATVAEAEAILGPHRVEGLLDFASVAVVKRGADGATVLASEPGRRLRFEVATEHIAATDTTGAGDAFDAGFIVVWLAARPGGQSTAALHRAALAGHRAAARHLTTGRPELDLA